MTRNTRKPRKQARYAPPPAQPCGICHKALGADPALIEWSTRVRRYAHAACIGARRRRIARAQAATAARMAARVETQEVADIRKLIAEAQGRAM